MRYIIALLAILIMVPYAAGEVYFKVNDITMSLVDEDALFELNYTLDSFARLYVLALGCGYIEPDLISMFKSYSEVKTVRANPDSAALLVKKAGKNNSGYYLFDSRPLGVRIAKFTVVYPGGLSRTFHNLTSTPNVFCVSQMTRSELTK
jgi:hypothetical protein